MHGTASPGNDRAYKGDTSSTPLRRAGYVGANLADSIANAGEAFARSTGRSRVYSTPSLWHYPSGSVPFRVVDKRYSLKVRAYTAEDGLREVFRAIMSRSTITRGMRQSMSYRRGTTPLVGLPKFRGGERSRHWKTRVALGPDPIVETGSSFKIVSPHRQKKKMIDVSLRGKGFVEFRVS